MTRRERKDNYQFRDEYLWDLDLVLNIVDGGVKEIPTKRGWSLERDHIFPQSQLQQHNISLDVNDIGNFRLLAKSRNIAKSDSMPDNNTEFFGIQNTSIHEAFETAIKDFTQDNFSNFVRKRRNILKQKVEIFLGFKDNLSII